MYFTKMFQTKHKISFENKAKSVNSEKRFLSNIDPRIPQLQTYEKTYPLVVVPLSKAALYSLHFEFWIYGARVYTENRSKIYN